MEDIGKILGKGFETYTGNLNLSVPFVLTFFIEALLGALILGLGFLYIFGSSFELLKSAATPEAAVLTLIPIITQHLPEILTLVALFVLISAFFQSFFIAGAIGMAQKATETGKSELPTMMETGKKNVINLYLADILVSLLYLAGIVFLVPGAMKADIGSLLSPESTGAILLLFGGFLLWIIYVAILSLVLAIFSYALVIENLGAIDGILEGIRFFKSHKLDVLLLWLITGAIVLALALIGQVAASLPIINVIWPFVNILLSVLVIPPLTTLWWVRLYMARTNKKLYFNELLAHPSELEKQRANQ